MNLNDNERKVLAFLADQEGYDGFCFSAFAAITADTGLDKKQVRRACRSLARKGLARYERALWNEDGGVAGAGYGATRAGAEFLTSSAP